MRSITDYDRSDPLVLVQLSRVGRDALHELLPVSWWMTAAKARKRGPLPARRCDDMGYH
jgi:hypothetical protein